MKLTAEQSFDLFELAEEELKGARVEYGEYSFANAIVTAARAYGMIDIFLSDRKNTTKRVYYEMLEDQVIEMIRASRRNLGI